MPVENKRLSLFGVPLPLVKGLAFTLKTFFTKPITYQYPEQKREPAPEVSTVRKTKTPRKKR